MWNREHDKFGELMDLVYDEQQSYLTEFILPARRAKFTKEWGYALADKLIAIRHDLKST